MTYDRSRFISAPWEGWKDDLPSMLSSAKSFRQITGWLLNKGRVLSFPSTPAFTGPPNGEAISGADTFEDLLANIHTGILTKDRAYYLNAAGYLDQGAITPSSNLAFDVEVYLNRMFFVNGVGTLQWLDGSQGIQNNSDAPGTAFFLSKLAGSLFMLNLFENSQRFPISVRWSAVNNHLEWNIAIDPTAGSAIIPEVEDEITGVNVMYGNMVIYRSHGISILTPTGGFPRFSISSFENGPQGVGVFYDYTLGNYGPESVFAAEDDMYYFSMSSPQPIGGKAKKSIFKDLVACSSVPWACLLGALGPGIDYKAYWLNIPLTNNTITSTWVFHFDDQTWVNEQLPFGGTKWMGNIAVS